MLCRSKRRWESGEAYRAQSSERSRESQLRGVANPPSAPDRRASNEQAVRTGRSRRVPSARDKHPMPNYTEPELRQRYCEAMGSDLGEVFHQLMQEAAWLHLKWNEYIALFANATRVNQLNRAAPGFFRMVEETWSDDLILHICRMTDKGNDVLTVRLIPKLVTVALRDEVNSRLRRLTAAVDFARDWRDRRIAHRNIALALDRSAGTAVSG